MLIGERLNRLVGYMVRFIQHIEGFGRIRQNYTASQRYIGQQQVVIRHHDVHIMYLVACRHLGAGRKGLAATVQAAMPVGRDARPQFIRNRLLHFIAITRPAAAFVVREHLAQPFYLGFFRLAFPGCTNFEHIVLCAPISDTGQLVMADVAGAPLGDSEGEG